MRYSRLSKITFLIALFLTSSVVTNSRTLNIDAAHYNEKFIVFDLERNHNNEKVRGAGYLMGFLPTGEIRIIKKYPITYGLRGSHKRKMYDRKTPIGKYKIVREKIRKRSEYQMFGGYSLDLNYPNKHDRLARRTGAGIAIHGGRLSPTYGCVRILDGNEDIPKFGRENIRHLIKSVNEGTPVVIAEHYSPGLLGYEGDYLELEAALYWKDLLSKDLGRSDLKNAVTSYNPFKNPMVQNKTVPAPNRTMASYSTSTNRSYHVEQATRVNVSPIVSSSSEKTASKIHAFPTIKMPVAQVYRTSNVVIEPKTTTQKSSTRMVVQKPIKHTQYALPKKVNVKIKASSIHENNPFYAPTQLIDTRSITGWMPSVLDDEKTLTYTYERPTMLNKMRIKIGYDKVLRNGNEWVDMWRANARAAKVRLCFDNGTCQIIDLQDIRMERTYYFDKSQHTKTVKVEILDIYEGDRYTENVCISELKFE